MIALNGNRLDSRIATVIDYSAFEYFKNSDR